MTRSWKTVHATVATWVGAPSDRVAALFLDYEAWPRIFPATIASVKLARRDATSVSVMVGHRREGQVLNVLRTPALGIVALTERKPRYEATFVNHFDDAGARTYYWIDAEVRLRFPYSLLAPFLGGIVRRALRRYTLEPMRAAAEAQDRDERLAGFAAPGYPDRQ